MVVFGSAPRISPIHTEDDQGFCATYTSFGGKPYAQLSPRLNELIPINKRPPPPSTSSTAITRRFRFMAAQLQALDRGSFVPQSISPGSTESLPVFGIPRPPATPPKHSPRSAAPLSERDRNDVRLANAAASAAEAALHPSRGDALIRRTADQEGPGGFNVRDLEEFKLRSDKGNVTAVFRVPSRPRDRGDATFSARASYTTVHMYESPLTWPTLCTFHKQQPRTQNPPRAHTARHAKRQAVSL